MHTTASPSRRVAALLAAGLLSLATACSGGGGAGSTTTTPSGAAADATAKAGSSSGASAKNGGSCTAKITGDATGEINGGGGVSVVNSDYWYTQDEMTAGASLLGKTADEIKADIAAGRFVFYPFLVNCGTGDSSINFLTVNGATRADYPFGPKTYAIAAGGVLGTGAKPGEVSVLVNIAKDAYKSNGGSFDVKKFDKTGLAGTFTLQAEEAFATGAPKKVTIEGAFDLACTGSSSSGAGKGCK